MAGDRVGQLELPLLYLFWIAKYTPRPLVGFGMLAYVLALVSGFTSILAPGSAVAGMQMVMVAPVMLFELVFGLWLAIRSVGVPVAEHPESRETIPTGLGERTAVANTSV